jgi:simple sugar transport system permease protein
VIIVTVVVIIYFALRNANFYSSAEIATTLQYLAPYAVIGAGEVLLLVLAEIDLSAGQMFLTAPWIVFFLQSDHVPLAFAIVIALVCSLAVGAINGLITVVFNVPSLIVTLGTNYALEGIVLIVSNATQADMPGSTGEFGQIFGIGSYSEIIWALGIVAIIWVLLKKTRFGVRVTATGGNLLGAAEAGIPVKRVKVWSFMILSLGAGFIGILDAIRIQSLDPASPGLDVVLPGIVAAVIGGTVLTGGRGTVLGTLIGAVFLGVLESGFNIIGVSANLFILAEGIVILAAMVINVQLGNLAERTKR